MRKLAVCLALMGSPLCADNYVSVGMGPYFLLPNIGIGCVQEIEIGELDFNANVSFSYVSMISEVKTSLRIPYEDYYFGPSAHIDYENHNFYESEINFGMGMVFGKYFDESFIEISLQDKIDFSGDDRITPALKIRYGVNY